MIDSCLDFFSPEQFGSPWSNCHDRDALNRDLDAGPALTLADIEEEEVDEWTAQGSADRVEYPGKWSNEFYLVSGGKGDGN